MPISGDNSKRRYDIVAETRRRWSKAEKLAIVAEALVPDVKVTRPQSHANEQLQRVWALLSVDVLRSIEATQRISVDFLAPLLGFWSDHKPHVRDLVTRAQRACASGSRLVVPLLVVGFLVVPRSGGLAGPAGSTDYTLGSQDKIRLKVFEWRASRDEIFEWTAFNAEYTVGQGGKISLPLIGEMLAAGKSPTELSQAIGQILQTRIGLAEPPSISVEVVQFRPFYIVGDIERPGEYAYRPGITLLQAITIAGGMPRAKNLSSARLERESIATRVDLRLLERDLVATLARKARLTSELQASEEIAIPDELNASATDTSHRAIINQETVLFQSRKEAFATQVRALEQLKVHHEMEAASLVKQLEMHDTLIDLLKPELDAVQELYKKQLVAAHASSPSSAMPRSCRVTGSGSKPRLPGLARRPARRRLRSSSCGTGGRPRSMQSCGRAKPGWTSWARRSRRLSGCCTRRRFPHRASLPCPAG